MRRGIARVVAVLFTGATATTFSQSGTSTTLATYVTAEEIDTVVKAPGGGDREIKIVDVGKYNVGVAVLRRGPTKPGAAIGAINHTKVTEVYYVVDGEGTLVTGGEVKDVKAVAPDSDLVKTIVGPATTRPS